MKHDRGAAVELTGFVDRECTVAGGLPLGGLVFAGPAGDEGDPVGNHERRVKTDAELTNQGCQDVGRLFLPQTLQQFPRSGLRDGSDIGDYLVAAHADAVVLDRQCPLFRVAFDPDLELVFGADQLGLAERFESKPIQRV